MKTSVVGYPRIGALRELKFATEKYLKGVCPMAELQKTAALLRKAHWQTQKENSIDFIPSNDFSFYDNMLDTAVLLNVIPKRYKELNLDSIDMYFAMARGYQGVNGDVKALAMRKWFNTNYHYMVPEIDNDTEIVLAATKPFDEYQEAKNLGIETKPVIIGAFTLLKLAKFTGHKSPVDCVSDVIKAYSAMLQQFNLLGTEWVQFDEPALVLDLTADDINLFHNLYCGILGGKGNTKVLLQTYFGDIRDCYNEIISLAFDGIGLDLVEGKKTLELVQSHNFPTDQILFAGVVNGKNIWRNNYRKTLNIISELRQFCDNIVLSTSCSLLHVPYTLKNENSLSRDYTKHFAFAEKSCLNWLS